MNMPRCHGVTYCIIFQASKCTGRNTHCSPPLHYFAYHHWLNGLKHTPRQRCSENVVLFFRDGKNLSIKHVSPQIQTDIRECLRCSKNSWSPCLFPLLCLPGQPCFSPHGEGAGGGGEFVRDLGVKFQRGSRNPASIILSSGHQAGHFVSNTLRGRESSVKIKRLQSGKNHKNHISSDKLLSRMEKTVFGVVCWEERIFFFFLSGTGALPFDVRIPRLWQVL